jgi:hypothetical protein
MGNTLTTDLSSTTLFGAASVRYVLASWLQPQARLALGASLLNLAMVTQNEPQDEDDAFSPFASLGAGFLLRSPTRSFENHEGRFAALSFGVLFEAGYALRAPVNFKLGSASSPTAIPLTQAKLGELSLGGPYIRTSLVSRF